MFASPEGTCLIPSTTDSVMLFSGFATLVLPAAGEVSAVVAHVHTPGARVPSADCCRQARLLRAIGCSADDSLQAFRRQGDFNQDNALKLGRAEAEHGIKIPAHLAENLRVPSQVGLDRARERESAETKRLRQLEQSNERTEGRISELQADELERLPGDDEGQSLDSIGVGTVGRATRGRSLVPYLTGERDRAQRQPKIDSEVVELGTRSRANTARAGTGMPGLRYATVPIPTSAAASIKTGTRLKQ